MHGLRVKKLRGRSKSVMGSAGMTGKSSGAGKWVRPKVCQSTTSVLSMDSDGLAPIQAGRPAEGSPEVCGTWRPAGWICSSLSGGPVLASRFSMRAFFWERGDEEREHTLCDVHRVSCETSSLPYQPAFFD